MSFLGGLGYFMGRGSPPKSQGGSPSAPSPVREGGPSAVHSAPAAGAGPAGPHQGEIGAATGRGSGARDLGQQLDGADPPARDDDGPGRVQPKPGTAAEQQQVDLREVYASSSLVSDQLLPGKVVFAAGFVAAHEHERSLMAHVDDGALGAESPRSEASYHSSIYPTAAASTRTSVGGKHLVPACVQAPRLGSTLHVQWKLRRSWGARGPQLQLALFDCFAAPRFGLWNAGASEARVLVRSNERKVGLETGDVVMLLLAQVSSAQLKRAKDVQTCALRCAPGRNRQLVRRTVQRCQSKHGGLHRRNPQGCPYVAVQAKLPYKDDAWHICLEPSPDGSMPETEGLCYLEVVKQVRLRVSAIMCLHACMRARARVCVVCGADPVR